MLVDRLDGFLASLARCRLDISGAAEWHAALWYVVHAGEAPVPRFSAHWLYGDLHYHSQMTDNEGESAYTYRTYASHLLSGSGAMAGWQSWNGCDL